MYFGVVLIRPLRVSCGLVCGPSVAPCLLGVFSLYPYRFLKELLSLRFLYASDWCYKDLMRLLVRLYPFRYENFLTHLFCLRTEQKLLALQEFPMPFPLC